MDKEKDYFIGVDIGTGSVGWAATDEDLNLIKIKKRNFWGARLFREGKTAEDRRIKRSTRRRYDRRRKRLELLQEIFKDEMNIVDNNFFDKLKSSWVHPQDSVNEKIGDFIFDKTQTDEKNEYYKKYPTIWHLRYELLTNTEKQDLRLIYLALHHIIKHRGNFLYHDSEIGNQGNSFDIKDTLDELIVTLNNHYNYNINSQEFVELTQDTLKKTHLTKSEQFDILSTKLTKEAKRDQKVKINQLINSILGYKTNFDKIFDTEFKCSDYIKNLDESDVLNKLSDELMENQFLLELISNIHSWSILLKIIPDKVDWISQSFIQQYDDYKEDLLTLKKLFRMYAPEESYGRFFRNTRIKDNYYSYNKSKKNDALINLYKQIDKELSSNKQINTDEMYIRYKKRKEDESFLKVINTVDKGAIPHQLHQKELEKIIDNQSKYYPFLKENKDKIISILKFKIPYYVGPLNENSEFSWLKREKENIFPWNFDDVVDKKESEENFITRMTKNCSYLVSEKALPASSILYQEYVLLNELNKIRINGKLIDNKLKNLAVEQLFKKQPSVTKKQFINWLEITLGEINNYDITGLANENKFNGSMSSWYFFTKIGFDLNNKKEYDCAELIIKWATIHSDKKILKKRIEDVFPDLNENQLNQILKNNFFGWGRLSKKLLEDIQFELLNGSSTSIINRMRKTNDNFMQVITNKDQGIQKKLEQLMANNYGDYPLLEQIDQIPGSPAIKKGIYQSILLVEEIIKIMGKEPKKIFIEFARENGNKEPTKSRYTQLDNIYKDIKNQNKAVYGEYKKIHDELKAFKNNERKLSSDRIYLYFIQMGRCLYSGKKIDLDNIEKRYYEVDHIIPRSYRVDNSLDNKALVLREENQRKSDTLLLRTDIQHKMLGFWKQLRKSHLISEYKFQGLIRDRVSDLEKLGFINRQLVETRQIAKHVRNLLANNYPNITIRTPKAELSTIYRKMFDLYKIREINDYHHAHDAYLSIFIGEYLDRKMPWLNNYVLKAKLEEKREKEIEQLFGDRRLMNKNNSYGLIRSIKFDSDKWDSKVQNSKPQKYFYYHDCFITFKPEANSGEFYNQTLQSSSSKGTKVEIKSGLDTSLYGGYTSVNIAYITLVEYNKKIIPVKIPIYIDSLINSNQITLEEYLDQIGKLGKIVRRKLLPYTRVIRHGHPYLFASDTERWNAKQLILPRHLHKYLYYSTKGWTYEGMDNDFDAVLETLALKLETEYKEVAGQQQIIDAIIKDRQVINALSEKEKQNFVIELLKIFQQKANLPQVKTYKIPNLSSTSLGRMNHIGTNWKGYIIIDQSITGVYESRDYL